MLYTEWEGESVLGHTFDDNHINVQNRSGNIGDDFPRPPLSWALHNLGPGPPRSPSDPHSIDTHSALEAYPSYQAPASIYGEVENGGLGLQEPSQSHELDPDFDLENVGGGFALTRAMSGTLSEYTFPSSMPSPRKFSTAMGISLF